MSVTVINEKDPDVAKHVPCGLTPLSIAAVSQVADTSCVYIKGDVCMVWPLQKYQNKVMLKIRLEQGPAKICVFLHGNFAEECASLNNKDVVVISGVFIERNTSFKAAQSHPYQIIVDSKKTCPKVWVFKSPPDDDGVPAKKPCPSPLKRSGPSALRSYTYTPLTDLKAGVGVNVYGVVKYIKPPFKTQGTDWMMMVNLIDPSLQVKGRKFKCNLFSRDSKSFPTVEVGDILRLHRIRIDTHNGELVGCSGPSGFSWLAVDGSVNAPIEPRTISSSYSFNDGDIDKIKELRQFAAATHIDSPHRPAPGQTSSSLRQISQITANLYFDLICEVVSMCVITPDMEVVLRVWDGTKPQIRLHGVDIAGTQVLWYERQVRAADDCQVDVLVFDNHAHLAAKFKPGDVIKFTNLHTNRPQCSDRIELTLHGGSTYGRRVEKLHPDSEQVQHLKAELEPLRINQPETSVHDQELVSDDDSEPDEPHGGLLEHSTLQPDSNTVQRENHCMARTATVLIQHHSQPVSPISYVIQHSAPHKFYMCTVLIQHHSQPVSPISYVIQHSAPHKFRVHGRLMDFEPSSGDVADLIHVFCPRCQLMSKYPKNKDASDCDEWWSKTEPSRYDGTVPLYQCPVCQGDNKPELEYIFYMQFMLEDKTAWLVTSLWNTDAVDFIGYSSISVLKDKALFDRVSSAITKLTSQEAVFDCCVKSYNTDNGVRYQIFNTTLCTDDSEML